MVKTRFVGEPGRVDTRSQKQLITYTPGANATGLALAMRYALDNSYSGGPSDGCLVAPATSSSFSLRSRRRVALPTRLRR